MKFRLFRMGLEGAVAVANLVLLGFVLILMNAEELLGWKSPVFVNDINLEDVVWVLTFPIGWIGPFLYGSLAIPIVPDCIFIPLNAYFWGCAVAAIVNKVRSRKARRLASAAPPAEQARP